MIADAAEELPRKTRIWPYVLLATLVATVWAVVATAGGPISIEEVPNGTPHRLGVAIGALVGYALASAVFAAGITTLAFHFMVFRRRGPAAKSVTVFAIVAAIAFVFAAPSRLLAVGAYKHKLTDAVTAWEGRTSSRGDALRRQLQRQVAALHLEQTSLRTIERPEQVADGLARMREAANLQNQYRRELDAQLQTARGELEHLVLPEEDRRSIRHTFETDFAAPAIREADLNARIEQKAAEIFAFLQSSRNAWMIRDHHLLFQSASTLERFNALQGEMSVLMDELRALERTGSATPTGSAPPPPR